MRPKVLASLLAALMIWTSAAAADDDDDETEVKSPADANADADAAPKADADGEAVPSSPSDGDAVGMVQVMNVARSKAEQGLREFAANNWQEAFNHFRVADQLFHAPTLVMYMAHCQRELGDLVQARGLYQQVVADPIPEQAPPAYQEAAATSAEQLELLEARIPRIDIVVTGLPTAEVRARLDDRPAALHPAEIRVNPGTHVIDVIGPRADPVTRTVEVVEGQQLRVDIELVPVVPISPPSVGIELPLIFGGVGLLGVGVGAVTGAIVLGNVSDLEDRCGGFTCPTSEEQQQSDTKPFATISTIGFVAGGVAIAAAAVLLTVHLGTGDAAPTIEASTSSVRFTATF